MTNSFLIDYTAYMRSLATRHRALRHRTDEKHFFRGELQEFFQQFRSDVRFPCLLVEGSDNEYSGTADMVLKQRNTSFIIADRYDQHDDYDEIQLRMSHCEQVAEQLMGRLLSDDTSGNPFSSIDVDTIVGQYLQNEAERYVGYRLSFTGTTPSCLYDQNAFDNEAD